MSPRFASTQDEEPCRARVVADLLERPEPVGAERLEERGLRLHGDDVRPDGVDDPLAEACDRRRRGGSAEHGLAAQLHRQEVEARVEPDDELALLARDGLGEPVGEVGGRHSVIVAATLRARDGEQARGQDLGGVAGRRSAAPAAGAAGSRRRRGARPRPRERATALRPQPRPARPRPRARPAAPRGIAPRRHASARDEERAPEAGSRAGARTQSSSGAEPIELVDARRDLLERGDAIAQPRGILEAQVARETSGAWRGAAAAHRRGRRPRSRRARGPRAARGACSRSARSGSAPRRRPSDRRGARGRTADGRPARVRRRAELADQAELLERGLELGSELAPLDPLERAERSLDRGPLAIAREVRAKPSAQVARLADVEHRVVAVAEEVDAGRRRRPRDERALRVELPRARRGELDDLARACARRAPARARGARSGSPPSRARPAARGGTARTTCRRSARAGASEKRSLRRCRSRRASHTVSTTGAATRRPVSRSTARSRKPTSKRALCAASGASPANARKRRTASSGRGARRSSASRRPVKRGDRRRQRDAGSTSVSNVSATSSALHANGADLAHAVARGREPGRLEVEDDELGVLDQRLRLRLPSARPTRAPSQARRASPSTTSASSECASVAGARSSAKSARAASSAATAPRRAWTSSTSRSAASNESCIVRHRIRTYVRIQGQTKGRPRERPFEAALRNPPCRSRASRP